MFAPTSSASLERFFSTFGYEQSKIRNRLSLQHNSKVVCRNCNLRDKDTDIDDSVTEI